MHSELGALLQVLPEVPQVLTSRVGTCIPGKSIVDQVCSCPLRLDDKTKADMLTA